MEKSTHKTCLIDKYVVNLNAPVENTKHNVVGLLNQLGNVQNKLMVKKDKITNFCPDKIWDKYKKSTNEYEHLSCNGANQLNCYAPISRSFFKLWEILNDFQDEIIKNRRMRVLFLAEGPGGFIEAFVKKRYGYNDTLGAITLKSVWKSVPQWKLSKKFMNRVQLIDGVDGTGNLYNIKNINYMIETFGANSMDLITGDGGFDCSIDFNKQEDMSFRLIFAEITTVVNLQSPGGSCVIKIFDTFSQRMMKLLQVVTLFYNDVYIVKPVTSRPANSEKYIVATGFKINPENTIYKKLLFTNEYNEDEIMDVLNNIQFDANVLHWITTYSIYHVEKQINYIQKIFDCIVNKMIINDNLEASQKWCCSYSLR